MSRITLNPKTARLSVSLDEQTYLTLCAIAEQDDVSVAWVVRRAVHDLVKSRSEKDDQTLTPARRASARRTR